MTDYDIRDYTAMRLLDYYSRLDFKNLDSSLLGVVSQAFPEYKDHQFVMGELAQCASPFERLCTFSESVMSLGLQGVRKRDNGWGWRVYEQGDDKNKLFAKLQLRYARVVELWVGRELRYIVEDKDVCPFAHPYTPPSFYDLMAELGDFREEQASGKFVFDTIRKWADFDRVEGGVTGTVAVAPRGKLGGLSVSVQLESLPENVLKLECLARPNKEREEFALRRPF